MLRYLFCLAAIAFLLQPLTIVAQQGEVRGSVMDGINNGPLEFAVTSLRRTSDSLLLGGTTDDKGNFVITNVKPGTYVFKISYVGYVNFVDTLTLTPSNPSHTFPVITLQAAMSEQVDIVEEVDMVQAGIDKTIYRVGKDISSAGSSAADILQNVPSVTLDQDRNIQFRGNANVQVLINGRPATLTGQGGLEQLPASMIDRVEIISNPSAKYDPDGTAGIINIVTRNNDENGLSGSVTTTAGTGDKYTGSVYLNYRTKKLSLYSNLAYNDNRFLNSNFSERKNFILDTTYSINNLSEGFSLTRGVSANLGCDLNLGKHNTAGASGLLVQNWTSNLLDLRFDFLDSADVMSDQEIRNTDQVGSPLNLDATAYFKHTFENPDHFLAFDFAYSGNMNLEELDAVQYSPFSSALPSDYQRTSNNSARRILTPQINYQRVFAKAGKLEAGVKAILRNIDQDFFSESSENGTDYSEDTLISNHIIYDDKVLSGYAVWSGSLKSWGYSAGLRAEQTFYSINQVTTGQNFPFDYFNLFPSARIKRKFKNGHETALSYSRRITRPSVEQLNPFPDWRDPYNLFSGNPYLRPEYTHSIEASYRGIYKKLNFSVAGYYKHSDSTLMRYRTVNDEGISFMTFANITGTRQVGSEVVLQYEPAKWWNMNINFNGYYQLTIADNLSEGLTNQGFSGSIRYIGNFIFWKKTASAQVLFNHNFPFVGAQGRGTPGTWLDLGFKKDFLPGKNLSLTFRVTDVMDTREFRFKGEGENFTFTGGRKRESRIAYIGLSYRFGNGKPPADRKPSEDMPQDGGGGGGM